MRPTSNVTIIIYSFIGRYMNIKYLQLFQAVLKLSNIVNITILIVKSDYYMAIKFKMTCIEIF